MTARTCRLCAVILPAPTGRGRPPAYCSEEHRRAARTAYEERRAAHAFAGARHDPDGVPGFVPEADAWDALADADGVPSFGASEGDRSAYLDARREYLDTLAEVRRRLGMTRTARGWTVPPPKASPCHACPLMRLPVLPEVSDEIERYAVASALRRTVEESLDN